MRLIAAILLLAFAIYLHVFRLPGFEGQGDQRRKYKELYHK